MISPFSILFLVLVFSRALIAGGIDEVTMQPAIQAPLADESLLLDAVSVKERQIVVGERGHILVSGSDDDWQQSTVPTRSMLTAVYFHDENCGWAVGHDAIIVATGDGGKTWRLQYFAPELEAPFLDVWFSDNRQGLAIGAYGLYFTTNDAGKTWTESELVIERELQEESVSEDAADFAEFYELHLNSIAESPDGTLYIAAEAGRIYRSTNGGETWVELVSPYVGSFFGILPLQDESLLVFGLRGHLFRSEDQGASWQAVETNTNEMLTNGIQLADGRVIVVGLGGTVLVSNTGMDFRLAETGTRTGYAALIQTDDGELVVVGENGVEPLLLKEH